LGISSDNRRLNCAPGSSIVVELSNSYPLESSKLSFTRAAEALDTSQAAISLKLKRLEERLGYRLLERTPRHVRLSPQGERFIVAARALLNAHERALGDMATHTPRRLVIGISDHVLRKPDALTDEEFELIKEHPTLGARILRTAPFLTQHLPIVELHHERPDGRGYPYGLTGDEIPLLARIVHVADAFDAMTSARAYRPALDTGYATRELWRFAGTQFDAEVVQALVQAVAVSGASPATEPAAQEATPAPPRLALVPARS